MGVSEKKKNLNEINENSCFHPKKDTHESNRFENLFSLINLLFDDLQVTKKHKTNLSSYLLIFIDCLKRTK